MAGTRKTVSLNSFSNLLTEHNIKFPEYKLEVVYSKNNIVFINKNKNFIKECSDIVKAFNYLKQRYYYNRKNHAPKLGYSENQNAVKR